jgi:hypothetical protein
MCLGQLFILLFTSINMAFVSYASGDSLQQRKTFDVSDSYRWILYYDPETHTQEAKLVHNALLDSFILVQDIKQAPSNRPAWLSNFPVLVDTKRRVAYRGQTCFKQLVSIELPPEHARRLQQAQRRKQKFEDQE